MSKSLGSCVAALALVLTAACGSDGSPVLPRAASHATSAPAFTQGSGSKSSLLARSTFLDPKDPNFMVRRITGDWHVEVKSKPALDIAVQSIHFDPGSQSGWHRHPGPAFIQVVYGTMTFYESDDPTCTPIVRHAGESYLDFGADAHIARNETADSARNVVTYLVPPGAQLRIDAPAPGNCPF